METLYKESKDFIEVREIEHENPAQHIKKERIKYNSTVEILLLIRQYRLILVLSGLITLIISFLIFHFFYISFSARVTFFIDDSNPNETSTFEPERQVISHLNSLSKNRMYLLIFSDEMISRLDRQIGLGAHYGYEKSNPDYQKQILDKFNKMVNFNKDFLNTFSIEAKDYNKQYAATLANSIFENLAVLNRETIGSILKYKRSIYNMNINEYASRNARDMDKFMQALERLPAISGISDKNGDPSVTIKRDLNNMFTEYNNNSFNLFKNEIKYELTSDVLRDTTIKSLFLINKAYPGSLRSQYYQSFYYSFCIGIAAMLYILFSIYLFRKFKPYLQILYKKELPEIQI